MTMLARLAYVVSKRGPTIAVVLLLLGTTGLGAAGWMYANPPTTEITDHDDRRTVESSLSTRAVVTGETALYRQGTTVEDQPVYLTRATPNLTLGVRTRLPSASEGYATQRIEVVYTASRNGEVFWKRMETLDAETTRDGRLVTTRATISMPERLQQLEDYQEELGDAATVSVSVATHVEYGVGAYEGEFDETTAVRTGSGWYAVPTETTSRTHSTPETRTVELDVRDQPRFQAFGALGAVLFAAGLLVAGLYRVGGRNRSTATLEARVHHDRYADWISRGTLPRDDLLTTVETDSLEGLVDLAIDTGERVIYDADCDRYAVLRGGTKYVHDPERGNE